MGSFSLLDGRTGPPGSFLVSHHRTPVTPRTGGGVTPQIVNES